MNKIHSIVAIINEIGEHHRIFSERFFIAKSFNFKKLTVKKSALENNEFVELLESYIKDLSDYLFFVDLNARFRVKTEDSALNKLSNYLQKEERGAVPIQKVLNDLAGFRIILEFDDDYEKLLDEIKTCPKLTHPLFRDYIRRDGKYIAIHLYLTNKNNCYLPWEIQVWKTEDEISNERSHKEHKDKRKYIDWAIDYKKIKEEEV